MPTVLCAHLPLEPVTNDAGPPSSNPFSPARPNKRMPARNHPQLQLGTRGRLLAEGGPLFACLEGGAVRRCGVGESVLQCPTPCSTPPWVSRQAADPSAVCIEAFHRFCITCATVPLCSTHGRDECPTCAAGHANVTEASGSCTTDVRPAATRPFGMTSSVMVPAGSTTLYRTLAPLPAAGPPAARRFPSQAGECSCPSNGPIPS